MPLYFCCCYTSFSLIDNEIVILSSTQTFFWVGVGNELMTGMTLKKNAMKMMMTKPMTMKKRNVQYLKLYEKKQVKKRPGRKSRWCPKSLDDFIDIIVNNDLYKKKLIFVNTKNQSNGIIYEKVLQELKQRASSRGDKFTFKVPQLRTKFKKCVSICKQAALTQKTATGIKRFQEEEGLGKWFAALYEVVKTRDSCQPDQALEPSSSEKSFNDDADNQDAAELFVPVKKIRKRVTAKDKLDTTTTEVLNLVREAVSTDPTRDLLNFMREEMDKSRQHELQLFQMLQSRRTNSGSDLYHHQATTYPAYPPTQPYTQNNSVAPVYYPAWQGGLGQSQTTQSLLPGGSYGVPSSTSGVLSNDRHLTIL